MQGPSEVAIEEEELDYHDVMTGLFDIYAYRNEDRQRQLEFIQKVEQAR